MSSTERVPRHVRGEYQFIKEDLKRLSDEYLDVVTTPGTTVADVSRTLIDLRHTASGYNRQSNFAFTTETYRAWRQSLERSQENVLDALISEPVQPQVTAEVILQQVQKKEGDKVEPPFKPISSIEIHTAIEGKGKRPELQRRELARKLLLDPRQLAHVLEYDGTFISQHPEEFFGALSEFLSRDDVRRRITPEQIKALFELSYRYEEFSGNLRPVIISLFNSTDQPTIAHMSLKAAKVGINNFTNRRLVMDLFTLETDPESGKSIEAIGHQTAILSERYDDPSLITDAVVATVVLQHLADIYDRKIELETVDKLATFNTTNPTVRRIMNEVGRIVHSRVQDPKEKEAYAQLYYSAVARQKSVAKWGVTHMIEFPEARLFDNLITHHPIHMELYSKLGNLTLEGKFSTPEDGITKTMMIGGHRTLVYVPEGISADEEEAATIRVEDEFNKQLETVSKDIDPNGAGSMIIQIPVKKTYVSFVIYTNSSFDIQNIHPITGLMEAGVPIIENAARKVESLTEAIPQTQLRFLNNVTVEVPLTDPRFKKLKYEAVQISIREGGYRCTLFVEDRPYEFQLDESFNLDLEGKGIDSLSTFNTIQVVVLSVLERILCRSTIELADSGEAEVDTLLTAGSRKGHFRLIDSRGHFTPQAATICEETIDRNLGRENIRLSKAKVLKPLFGNVADEIDFDNLERLDQLSLGEVQALVAHLERIPQTSTQHQEIATATFYLRNLIDTENLRPDRATSSLPETCLAVAKYLKDRWTFVKPTIGKTPRSNSLITIPLTLTF